MLAATYSGRFRLWRAEVQANESGRIGEDFTALCIHIAIDYGLAGAINYPNDIS
jgi:hypothetical protein